MNENKKVIILVIIALILATTAIALNMMDSEVSTTRASTQEGDNSGQIGIEIQPSPVEDKLTQETPQQ